MALSDDFSRGLIQKSTYIRLAIASPRYDQGDSYQVQVPLAGVTLSEVFTEASLMVRDEFIDIAIAPFTISWAQPELLPSFSPTTVQTMQIGGRGYLYFALGADNQSKTKTFLVDPSRLYSFYKMSRPDFLAELGRLLESKTATVDISSIAVKWLNKSAPAAREFGSIPDVVTQLRKEMAEAIATNQPKGDYALAEDLNRAIASFSRELSASSGVSTLVLNEAIASLQAQIAKENAADTAAIQDAVIYLQEGINSRNNVVNQALTDAVTTLQARITAGDSAQANALLSSVNLLQAAINGKQASGDYVPTSALRNAIASLQTVIDTKQVAGDYATTQAVITAVGNLQKAIDSKNYVMGDAFNSAIGTLQAAINTKQATGDYATNQALTNSVQLLQQALTKKQTGIVINASDFGAKGDLVYREVSYNQVAIVSGTDTTANIQAALNKAGSMVPQDLNLPYESAVRVKVDPGKYIIAGDKGLEIPSNVIFDAEEAMFFNFLSNDWEPAIKGRRHSHATKLKLHGNKKSGIEWGDRTGGGVRCDSYIDSIWVEHCGVEYESTLAPNRQKCGLRTFGLWYRINRVEVKEANVCWDLYQCSDVICPSVFLMGGSVPLRLESAEQIILPAVALDTNIDTGIMVNNSGNVWINVIAFTNSDGYGTPWKKLIDVGTFSGIPCKSIYINAAATSTGGQMLVVSNCMDSAFTLFASNARLFSQTSGNGQATSHWQAINWTSASGQVNGGGLLAHDIGTDYQPAGSEGKPIGVVKYGGNLSGYLNVNLTCDPAIARIEGQVYGNLLINGNKYGVPVPRSIMRVNCGGSQYSESGKVWLADQYVVGGGGTAVPTNLAGETDLIKSIRWGLTGYDIPLAPGVYSLNLWFIEPENQYRKFDISIQGQVWQTDFCIYDEAGMAKLLFKGFNNVIVGSTNILTIRFTPKVADAIITALEVFQ